ncbi:MAG: carbon-nitrogen hydrolase family protein [Gammaproteobacteria bacterium]|nr:carbon-nitrogen hydrolase family protein [Gammaproteobacteria bacterium]MDH3466280.1 carbon-nitrogen hydrolase family protein [Gammaproteobacteria bacterium]
MNRQRSSRPFTAACIQNCAGTDMAANIDDSAELIREAHAAGAEFIATPEFFSCLDKSDDGLEVGAHPESTHPALLTLSSLARELEAWLLLGSLAIKDGGGRLRNRSLLIDNRGRIVARYDKIHMFDVDLANGESYRESELFVAGDEAVIAPIGWGMLGLSVCYDLRFPHLYRQLAQAGAQLISVPAAFTKTTGEAHWHTLLQARAIETGCFVLAPCQFGRHGAAATYGHSLIIDPWGRVLADGGEERGFVSADINLSTVDEARRMIPALSHDRDFRVVDNAPTVRLAGTS